MKSIHGTEESKNRNKGIDCWIKALYRMKLPANNLILSPHVMVPDGDLQQLRLVVVQMEIELLQPLRTRRLVHYLTPVLFVAHPAQQQYIQHN